MVNRANCACESAWYPGTLAEKTHPYLWPRPALHPAENRVSQVVYDDQYQGYDVKSIVK